MEGQRDRSYGPGSARCRRRIQHVMSRMMESVPSGPTSRCYQMKGNSFTVFLERMSDTQCASAQHNSENSTQGSVLSPSLPVGKGGPFMSKSEHIARKRAHRSLATTSELIVSWRSSPSRTLQGPTPATRDTNPNVFGEAGVSPQCGSHGFPRLGEDGDPTQT